MPEITCPTGTVSNEYNYIYDGTLQKIYSNKRNKDISGDTNFNTNTDGGPVTYWPYGNYYLIGIDFTSCLKNISGQNNYDLSHTPKFSDITLFNDSSSQTKIYIKDNSHNLIGELTNISKIRQQNIQDWNPSYDRLLFLKKKIRMIMKIQ